MKALTICQPYAHLIVTGKKRVENRTWPTRYRGPLVIHAGKSWDWMPRASMTDAEMVNHFGAVLPFGVMVGLSTLVDCLPLHEILAGKHDARYPWIREHEHTNGPWCWVLENVEPLKELIPYRGKQGLFDVEIQLP